MTREEAIKKLTRAKLEFLEQYVDYSGLTEAYDMAISSLERERWISVNERLPEDWKSVLVRRKDGGMFIWEYNGSCPTDEVWIDDSCNVYSIYDSTHWRYLPEPPKEET